MSDKKPTTKPCPLDDLDDADYIRAARLRAGMTQHNLAEALGVSDNTARAWEVEGRIPRPPMARRLADALGVTLPDLARAYGWLDREDLELLRTANEVVP